MVEIVKSTGQASPPRVEYSPRPLEQAAAPANREAPAVSPNYVRVLGSPAQNSRMPGSPKAGSWHVRWESPVSSPASAVLLAGHRVLVQRPGGWSLFDREGKHIADGLAGGAPITLDPSAGMFYALGNGNNLQAIGLEKGDLQFMIPLGYNESFAWLIFLRSGKRIVAAGFEQPMLSPTARLPERSLFQVIETASPVKLSPYKLLLSIDSQQDLLFREGSMIPVASGDVLWAALPDLLIRTSPAQNIDGAWSGAFKAVAASADEAGWLHLLVEAGSPGAGGRELWVITPEGKRTMRVTAPPAYADSKIPPAIGYNHHVYLRGAGSVAAFSPQGALLWDVPAGGPIAGMGAAPDGRIVAAAGANIVAIDSGGRVTHLATLPAPARTAPVVTAEGEILVGMEAGVVCLAAR